jgi:electron transport complex protein RnfE
MSERREGFIPNPVLAGLVGICPLIAVSRNLAEAAAYGLGAAFCAIVLGAVAPPLRSVVADRLQAPALLALSASLALVYAFCVLLYSPAIAAGLWVYLPLLAVSGLSLSALRRSASSLGRFGPDGQSRLGAITLEALLFLLTAILVGSARELIGLGTLTLPVPGLSPTRLVFADAAPLGILVSPAGGFIFLGFVVAAYRAIVGAGGRKSP